MQYGGVMKNFAVVARPDEYSAQLKQVIAERLTAAGYTENETEPETCFVVGGDGTFIYAVHKYLDHLDKVRFYGIHTGTLGFFTDYRDCEMDEFLDAFLSGKVRETAYKLFEVHTGKGHEYYALNEMRVENITRTQVIDVFVDGEHFETFRGTGFCVATQLGSTAYNRSLHGAVMQEGLNLIEMTEIGGIHHSKFRSLGVPIVMRDDITLQFRSDDFSGALLGIDSDVFALEGADELTVRISPKKSVRMLKGREVSYFARLQTLF